MQPSRRRGFTFVEILIVMIVLGLMSALAIPRYREFKERAYLSSLRTELGQLRIAEEAYWAEHQVYSTNLVDLDFLPSSDITLIIASTGLNRGWMAEASHALMAGRSCATYVGGDAQGYASGEIVCGVGRGGGGTASPTFP
jgi:prepilin-type N-terminal cleavage/methylation domain-containing protein